MKKQAGATKDNAQATQKRHELAHAALDLSCLDWLNFPHWIKVCRGIEYVEISLATWPISLNLDTLSFYKALELNDYPTFLLWLTDQDPVLASMVATRQEEFEAVLEKVCEKKARKARGGRQ